MNSNKKPTFDDLKGLVKDIEEMTEKKMAEEIVGAGSGPSGTGPVPLPPWMLAPPLKGVPPLSGIYRTPVKLYWNDTPPTKQEGADAQAPKAEVAAPSICECGSFKVLGAGRGAPGHSSWCPWAVR